MATIKRKGSDFWRRSGLGEEITPSQQLKLGKVKKMLDGGRTEEDIADILGIAMSEVRGYVQIIVKAEVNRAKAE
jgi:hypothetical protein